MFGTKNITRQKTPQARMLPVAQRVALIMALAVVPVAFAALTDLASAPVNAGGGTAVKPNIMLIMGTANSMKFSHMPDSVEPDPTVPADDATHKYMQIGYTNSQCNQLYYNPNQVYGLPKGPDGLFLPTPSFTAAEYDYYSAPGTLVNLSTSFSAYDKNTRKNQAVQDNLNFDPAIDITADPAQPAYYLAYSGPETLSYTASPCSDGAYTPFAYGVAASGQVYNTAGGGKFTKKRVTATSGPGNTDERLNFAIWYQYYRTRINLMKSAISLAFTPLTSGYRVGLITVLPGAGNPAAVPVPVLPAVQSNHYLPIDDFNTGQRANFWSTLFSQVPALNSPLRESLARVGRHYAGKQDGINAGMTGDPVQYSCQQNFAILTTDGYWNNRNETGGPAKLDGTTPVGEQDGTLTSNAGNSPRPIWDGGTDTTVTVQDRSNLYSYAPCTSTWSLVSTTQNRASTTKTILTTSQLNQSTVQNLVSTSQVQSRTVQNLQSTVQNLQSTQQNRASTTQNLQTSVQVLQTKVQNRQTTVQNFAATNQNLVSTFQNVQTTSQMVQNTAQNLQSRSQVTQSTVQNLKNTSQTVTQTSQTFQTTVQNFKATAQNLQTQTQPLQTTVQNMQTTVQNLASTTQTLKATFQTTLTTTQPMQNQVQHLQSTTQNLQTTTQNLQSTTQVTQSTSQVKASTVQNLQSTNQNRQSTSQNLQSTSQVSQSTNQITYSTTQLNQTQTQVRRSTSQTTAYDASTLLSTPVQTCTPSANITCTTTTTTPTLVASCTASSATAGNNWTTTTCTPSSVGPTPVGTCTPATASSGNSYTTTSCSTVPGGPTPTASCTPATASSSNTWTNTTCGANTTPATPVASCTTAAATSGNNYTAVTCSTATTTNVPVQTCSATGPTSGNNYTSVTCNTATTTNVPVQTCSATGPSSGNNWVTTSCNPLVTTNVPIPATCVASAATSANNWVATSCPSPVTSSPTPVSSCTPSGGSSPNWIITSCTPNNSAPVGVSSCTPSAGTSGNNWVTTSCANNNTSNVPVQTCTGSAAVSGNGWTTTSCSTNNMANVPVQTCTASSATSGNNWVTTSCPAAAVTTNVPVQTCTASGPTSGNSWVNTTCNNTNVNTPVQVCTGSAATSGNNWTTTSCSSVVNGPSGVQTCSPIAATSANNWTTTSCGTNNTASAPASSCTAAAASSGNSWTQTTCTPNNTSNVPVQTCTNTPASSGNNWTQTTCSNPAGTNNQTVPVLTCTPVTATSGNNWVTTTCSNPAGANNSANVPVSACTASSATSANNWVATSCSSNSSVNLPVASCSPSSATSANGWVTTSCSTNNTPATAVQTCTNQSPNSGNGFVTITCTNPTPPNQTIPVQTCTTQAATSGNSWVSISCNTNVVQTPSGTCTPVAASSANNWTTTTCPAAIVVLNIPIQNACVISAGNAGNNWTTTSCPAPVTTTNVPVGSCTATAGTAGNNWVTTSCGSNVVQASTPVQTCTPVAATAGTTPPWTSTFCATNNATNQPIQTCALQTATSANNWVTITCPGPIVNANVGIPATCVAVAASSGNNWTTTSCPAPITTPATPVLSCSPITASAGNNWTTTSCPTPITTPATAVQTCTNTAATSGNNWTSTTCTNPGPNNSTNVGVQTCNAQTATALNNWIGITCNNGGSNNTSNVAVSSCVPQTAASGNNWVTITCSNPVGTNFTNQPVQTCNAQTASSSNSWIGITCSNNNSSNVPVQTCANQTAAAGNSWIGIVCSTNNTTNVPIQNACVAVTATAANSWTTTSCPAPVVTTNVPVASCTASAGVSPSWITTTCSTNTSVATPVATCTAVTGTSPSFINTVCNTVNTGPLPAATCTPASPVAANSFTTTTCPAPITSGPTPVASCNTTGPSAGNNFVATSCNTVVVGPNGVASCTTSSPTAANQYTSTACGLVTSGPTPVSACAPILPVAGNQYTATTCGIVTSGPTLMQGCVNTGPTMANNWVNTTCAPAPGQMIQYTTTSTTTTTQSSGGFLVGTPAINSSTGGLTDLDGQCYVAGVAALPALPNPNPQRPGFGVAPLPVMPCTAWPCTATSGGTIGSVDSLSDVAQYYYVNDLRPSMSDDVPATGQGPEDDRAIWQHMTTFTISLGVSGTLNYLQNYKSASQVTGDFADLRTGVKTWPVWPAAGVVGNAYNDPRAIDDFWHTAVNGRGQYFSASNPTAVVTGLSSALAGINARLASSAAAATSNLNVVQNDNFVFSPSYRTADWTGEIQARTIDLVTGVVSPTAYWSAQSIVDATVGAACDNRNIYVIRQAATTSLVPFTWNTRVCSGSGVPTGSATTGLNAGEQANFSTLFTSSLSQFPAMTDGTSGNVDQRSISGGANLVNFLRGQRGLEGFVSNDLTKLYRTRLHVLGDVVNATPVYVKAPNLGYTDPGYAAFKTSQSGRLGVVYVAANDGMLHAFYAGTGPGDPTGGTEAWAVIPNAVLPNMYRLADTNYANLHAYYVDGSPLVGDAFDSTASAWKTILIGGLGGGGKGYYALDVTDPTSPKALWEFNWSATCYTAGVAATYGSDCHLGYTYGKPQLTKLAPPTGSPAGTEGQWVVLVTSGYNNVNTPTIAGDGQGYLYVLDAITGKIIYKIGTGVGNATAPSGLGQIAANVLNPTVDNTLVLVYGADLQGNIWRFDVNATLPAGVREATLLATAKDSSGTPQPITTSPQLSDLNGNTIVMVGTGELLGNADLTTLQQQSIYGIVDTLTGNPTYANLRSSLSSLTFVEPGGLVRTIACTNGAATCGTNNGWVVDLPDPGERVNVEMQLQLGILTVASNVLTNNNACNVGGFSWVNFLDFATGTAVKTAASGVASQKMTSALIVGINIIRLPSGKVEAIVTTSDTQQSTVTPPQPVGSAPTKRVSWREITP